MQAGQATAELRALQDEYDKAMIDLCNATSDMVALGKQYLGRDLPPPTSPPLFRFGLPIVAEYEKLPFDLMVIDPVPVRIPVKPFGPLVA
jgi:hypothetical protein